MDIEETQKINDLAKKLLSHKIASSSQDAYSKAEQIIKGTQKDSEKTESDTPEEKLSSKIYSELDSIKDLMEKFKEGFTQLSSNLNALAQNYEHLKNEVLSIKEEMKSKMVEKPKPSAPDLAVQNEQEEAKKAAEEKDLRHNTKSSYSEEDVSVDKIFYFGKK